MKDLKITPNDFMKAFNVDSNRMIEQYKAKKNSKPPTNLNFSGTGSVGLRLDLDKSDK